MITLTDKDTGEAIGSITEEQLQFLIDRLEEETDEDQDYWINRDELEVLKAAGADAELVGLLAKAMAGRGEIEIVWAEA